MFRMRHAAIILFASMLSALVLTANSVSAQTRTSDPPAVNGTMFLVAIIVAGIVELAIVAYWVFQSRRGRTGSRQMALWLMLPILAVLLFIVVGGGFTACGA